MRVRRSLAVRHRFVAVLVTTLCVLSLTPAHDALAQRRLGGPLIDGSVIRFSGCGNYFFVAFRNEYALAEWIGGDMVRENEVLVAIDDKSSFEREGRMTFTNGATGKTVDVVIERALLNQTDLKKLVHRYCR